MTARCVLASSVPHALGSAGPQARCVVGRAQQQQTSNTIFYAGGSYTESEWENALRSGNFKQTPDISGEPAIPSGEVATIRSLMAFDGPAPELINGRLAMIGFFAASGAEVASGEGVLMQLNDAPGAILVTYAVIAAATLIPLFQEQQPEVHGVGPFTAAAERINGRAAMIGLAFLMFAEHFTGGKALL